MRETEASTDPDTLWIQPPGIDGGSYRWATRQRGKLARRSDRNRRPETLEHARDEIAAAAENVARLMLIGMACGHRQAKGG